MRMEFRRRQNILRQGSVIGVGVLGAMLFALPGSARESAVPWECSGFTAEAQDRCIRTFTELQQEKIAKLEKDLAVQQQTVLQLQQKVSQQAVSSAELERQLTDNRFRWYGSSSVQVYPPFGLRFRFGRDRFWGGSLLYGAPRYWGPRFYGHSRHHWHRH